MVPSALTTAQRVFSCALLAASAALVMEPSTTLATTSNAMPTAIYSVFSRIISTASSSSVVAGREGDAPLK